MTDTYLLIAGIEYRTDKSSFFDRKNKDRVRPTDYRKVAFERAKQIDGKYPGKKQFILMDIIRGEIRETGASNTFTDEFKKHVTRSFKVTNDKFDRAHKKTHYGFVYVDSEAKKNVHLPQWANFPKLIGATDIYDQIMEIGVKAPGTLKEVSIFSHGFHAGPVLVNTYRGLRWTGDMVKGRLPNEKIIDVPEVYYEKSIIDRKTRDSLDKDIRPEDFTPDPRSARRIGNGPRRGYFARDELARLNAAFHPDAVWWLWGCNANHTLEDLFLQMTKAGLHKKKLPGNKVLKFKLRRDRYERLKDDYTPLIFDSMKKIGNPKKSPVKFTGTVDECIELLKIELEATYGFKVAPHLDAAIYTAAPGTWTDIDVNTAYLPKWMHPINQLFIYQFNLKEDRERQGFLDYS